MTNNVTYKEAQAAAKLLVGYLEEHEVDGYRGLDDILNRRDAYLLYIALIEWGKR